MSTTLYQPTGIEAYLEQREAKSDFVVVEFGHRAEPICFNQPDFYSGNRAYIGIEADLRDPIGSAGRSLENQITKLRKSQNWFFLKVCADAKVEYDENSSNWSYVYEGYDSRSLLPSGSVDEIFLGNVLSDPMISCNNMALSGLVNEICRIATPNAVIISRSTITPRHFRLQPLVDLGMYSADVVNVAEQKSTFYRLEQLYGTSGSVSPESAYHFFKLGSQDVVVEEEVVAEGAD